ncbi:unnamed protein product [Symbiodinium sp. CCMP2456]|nr:unnamed protein product [Symbiodinium sp. CCMP2456]
MSCSSEPEPEPLQSDSESASCATPSPTLVVLSFRTLFMFYYETVLRDTDPSDLSNCAKASMNAGDQISIFWRPGAREFLQWMLNDFPNHYPLKLGLISNSLTSEDLRRVICSILETMGWGPPGHAPGGLVVGKHHIHLFGYEYVDYVETVSGTKQRPRWNPIVTHTGSEEDKSMLVIEGTGIYADMEAINALIVPPFIQDVLQTWAWDETCDEELKKLRYYLDKFFFRLHCERRGDVKELLECELYSE